MASASVKYEPLATNDFKSAFAAPAETESSADAGISPKTERHEELIKLFKLPSSEVLVDDFICALRRKVLYQGRLYVFEHHACFYSHIFNYRLNLVIPLKLVTQIRKKKMYGFPNSIEIVWKGKRESFGSFLKRDSAYRLLQYAWNKSTPYAKLFGGVPEDSSPPSSPRANFATDSKKVLGKIAKLMYRKGDSHSKISPPPQDSESDVEDEKMIHAGRDPIETGSASELQSHLTESEDESEGPEAEGLENWKATAEAAPAADPSMSPLTSAEFNLPVRDFYKEFLSEQSQFLITWHESRGDTKVQLSEWHKHAVGHVRELTFITPLKQRIGPSKCLCTQTQRARLHKGDHLVFETSQIMDIPYGDHFAVEARWDVTPAAKQKGCKVEVRLAIPFSKRTIFRATIEGSTRALMKEAAEDWIATAHRWLEPPLAVRSAFEGAPSSSGGDDYDEPTHLNRAQSLAVRLSSDRVNDADLLLRAPTAHKSDIARMLQLQRRETERALNSSLSSRRSKLRTVSFDMGYPVKRSTWTQRLISRSALALLLSLLALLVLSAAAWHWHGRGWRSPLVGPLQWRSALDLLPRADRLWGWPARSDSPARLERLEGELEAIQRQLTALGQRLSQCEGRRLDSA